jgi:hypothetical protein
MLCGVPGLCGNEEIIQGKLAAHDWMMRAVGPRYRVLSAGPPGGRGRWLLRSVAMLRDLLPGSW